VQFSVKQASGVQPLFARFATRGNRFRVFYRR